MYSRGFIGVLILAELPALTLLGMFRFCRLPVNEAGGWGVGGGVETKNVNLGWISEQ